MGTQLFKGFENRLGDLEQRLQNISRAKKKPGPCKKKTDDGKKKPSPKVPPKGDNDKKASDDSSVNVGGAAKEQPTLSAARQEIDIGRNSYLS